MQLGDAAADICIRLEVEADALSICLHCDGGCVVLTFHWCEFDQCSIFQAVGKRATLASACGGSTCQKASWCDVAICTLPL